MKWLRPKAHILRYGGMWWCIGKHNYSAGTTVQMAYTYWKISLEKLP